MTTSNEAQQAMYMQHMMSNPKSPIGIYDLPCGVILQTGELATEVQVREITGVEEDLLVAPNIDGVRKMTQLLANCVERIGSVIDKEQIYGYVRNMTIGDRAYLMFAVRRTTLGDDFPHEQKCPSCGKKDLYKADLSTLAIKKMPEPMKRIVEVALPSGKKARFHVMTGRDQEVTQNLNKNDRATAIIMGRLEAIDDVPINVDVVKSLSLRDRTVLRDEFDKVEGGVETDSKIECDACGFEFTIELDPGSTGFFFPSRVRKS